MRATPRTLTSLALALIFIAWTACAQAPKAEDKMPAPTPTGPKTGLIPRKILFGNPDKTAARISPDGKHLSFLAPVDGVLNVWVGPIDDPSAAKPVTQDKKRGIRSYFWAYTNKHILYTQDSKGDENWAVYRVDLESGKTQEMTPKGDEKKPVQAQIQAVSHKHPGEILVGLNDRNPEYHDVYRLNLTSGEKSLVLKNTEFAGFVIDDDYEVRFGSKFTDDGGTVLMKPDGKGWAEFLKVPMADSLTTEPVGFNKTGDGLFLIDSRGRDTGALVALDIKSGKMTVLAANEKADVGSIMAHPTENTIQAVSFNYDRTKWEAKDAAVGADLEKLAKVADGEINVASRTLDDKVWIVAFLMDNGPVRYYLYDRPSQKAKFLFTNRKELESQPLQKMQPVILKSRDGLDLVSYLTLPPGSDPDGKGRPSKPVPMVLDVHGGPWARDNWGFDSEHQFLANRGYAVLSVNFRGSTGFGKKFLNAGNKEWAAKMQDDLNDAVDWAIKEKIADPAKVAILGGSYGGYATLVGMTFTPEKFACGVDVVGPSNLQTLLSSIPPYWAPAMQMFKDRVGDPTTDAGKKLLEERSPLNRVAQIRRPLLIGQGAHDPRVKQAEADQIVKAMKEHKIPVTYALFGDEGHGFARPENRLAFNAVTEAFLARYLGGRYEAIGEAFQGSSVSVPNGAADVPGLPDALKAIKPEPVPEKAK
jgi:dipeptidyl aminopeptidase/acylaminoacyl peptidase